MNIDKIQSEFDSIREKLHSIEILSAERSQKTEFMREAIERIEVKLESLSQEKQIEHKDFRERIGAIETWKAVFVAKMSVYTGIGITLGTIIAQLLVKWVSEKI